MPKIAVVTGGSRGIGAETSLALAREGYSVIINYNKSKVQAERIKELIESENKHAELFKADVSQSEQCDALFEFVREKFGRLDVLVNNAGIAKQNVLTSVNDGEWKQIIDTNLSSAFYSTRAAIPLLLNSKNGAIVVVSSIFGITGASCEAAYSASKGGLIAFTKSMAKELAPCDITVNCVCPGFIDTDMNNNLSDDEKKDFIENIPLCRAGKPSDVANAVCFLIKNRYTTGQVLAIDGGYSI